MIQFYFHLVETNKFNYFNKFFNKNKIDQFIAMWNMITCNNLTEQKMRKKSYEKHVKTVNQMKPKLKLTEPQQPWFIYAKKKKQLARNQQLHDIQKSNHLLLAKIKTIERRDNQTFKKPTFLTTLNSKVMKEINEEIFKENKRICQKIMQSQTFYRTKSILEKSNNLEKVLHNISVNSRRVQSAKSLAHSTSKIFRPKSSSIQRPQSSSAQSPSKSQFIAKFKESRLTRPQSAPSIKKYKIGQDQPDVDQKIKEDI